MGYIRLVSSKIIGLTMVFTLLLGSAHAIGFSLDLGRGGHNRDRHHNRDRSYDRSRAYYSSPQAQPYQNRAYYNSYYSYPKQYYYQQPAPIYYYYDSSSGYYVPYNYGY